ncbi:uncharacterized protein METZ01_LOCUS89015 [marine metagenome]|uniref:Uncharacterized protein n=1 Tax=marine metagenome TaxID=408172 RepID=A0A381V822_9ZZZZ
MDSRNFHNLTWVPMFAVGFVALTLGIVYVTIQDPWLLDKKANEALLMVTYEELFSQSENQYLPVYLTLMYRFFGWWLSSIGILILLYVFVTKMGTSMARNCLYCSTTIVLIGVYCIILKFIPKTPFLWVTHGLVFLLLVSVYGSVQLTRYK